MVTRLYYSAGGQRVAVRVSNDATPANNGLFYLLTDHLGSTSITANGTTGALVSEMRYKPWGETRYSSPTTTPTAKHYTGQYEESGLGSLYFYGARFYSPALGRFLSADTVVPGAGNPQNLNHFAYAQNNPIRYNDPSGHCPWCIASAAIGAVAGVAIYTVASGPNFQWTDFGLAMLAGGVGGALIGTGIGVVAGVASFSTVSALIVSTGVSTEIAGATMAGAGFGAAGAQIGYTLSAGPNYKSSEMGVAWGAGAVSGAVSGYTGVAYPTSVAGPVIRGITSLVAGEAQSEITALMGGRVPTSAQRLDVALISGASALAGEMTEGLIPLKGGDKASNLFLQGVIDGVRSWFIDQGTNRAIAQ
jgi:RHS repeat-associated protein